METSIPIEKPLFREEAELYQKEQKRTKSTALREGLIMVGVSALGLITIFLVRIITGGLEEITLLVALALIIIFVVGLVRIIISLVRSEKQVTCPKCGTEHEIFKKVRLYMCTDCWTLLYLGEDGDTPIRFLNCAYCGNKAAVTEDHGAFVCPNCGVTRSSTATAVDWKTAPCPDCEEAIHPEALYCIHCNQILKPLPTYDKDWEIGKDGHGHFHFARMLLATFPEEEAALEIMFKLEKPRSGKQQWPETFQEMPPMHTLARAQRSLEEALQEPGLRPLVEGLLPEIDVLYGRLLVLEIKMIQWAEGPDKVALAVKADFEKGTCLDIFDEGPHILARKRIEKILGPKSLESIGSIGPWKDQSLINTKLHFSKNYKGEDSSSVKLTNYAGLITEAKRFAEWTKKREGSADLLDTLQVHEEKATLRKKRDWSAAAVPSGAEKVDAGDERMAATRPAAHASTASTTSGRPRSTDEPAKSTRRLGCVLTTCGSLILAIALIISAGLVASIVNFDSTVDDAGEDITGICICLPIFGVGLGLLLFGISKLRNQKKKPSAAQFGGYRNKKEKEAWAQAMVGAEFITDGKYLDALAISEQALSLSPRCKEAWVVKGGALALMNRPEEALDCYEQALAIDPNYAEASTQKAMLLQSL